MKFTDIKIWYECNNYCFFCIQWDKRKKHKSKSIEEIKKILGEENVNQKIGIWKEVNNYYSLNIDLKLDAQVNILIQ